MAVKILELAGKRWAIIPERDYRRLAAHTGADDALPSLPKPDANGRFPAVEYARVSLARKVIKARRQAGWTQVELARRAGIRPETLNRIEKGRTTPDTATMVKIEQALESLQSEER